MAVRMRRMKPFGLFYERLVFLVSWSRVSWPVDRIGHRSELLALALDYISFSRAPCVSRRHAHVAPLA
ncbi:hypothetical protein CQ13_19240 [Bradyrhizobium retamae]|uniref:Uncharacterized protein n=1 Tax=Bradyrhizobium retamae TaxID=1300035 RepID=A0A0R3NFQ2_9BRAD|nr:hypothetical protein CQ13_19240 [Bradyrhizobium retamae]